MYTRGGRLWPDKAVDAQLLIHVAVIREHDVTHISSGQRTGQNENNTDYTLTSTTAKHRKAYAYRYLCLQRLQRGWTCSPPASELMRIAFLSRHLRRVSLDTGVAPRFPVAAE